MTPGGPFPTVVLEVSNKLFLLGVHRYHRLFFRQGLGHAFVDMMESRVTVRTLAAFQGLAVALKAEFLGVEQFANHGAADFVSHGGKFLRQPARAFAGPTQR